MSLLSPFSLFLSNLNDLKSLYDAVQNSILHSKIDVVDSIVSNLWNKDNYEQSLEWCNTAMIQLSEESFRKEEMIIKEEEAIAIINNMSQSLEQLLLKERNEYKEIQTHIKRMSNKYNEKNEITNKQQEKQSLKQTIVNQIRQEENELQKLTEISFQMIEIDLLKQWSGKTNLSIIYDTDIDGGQSNEIFINKVLNKSNLYFVTFDSTRNVFGGYINSTINVSDKWVHDPNAFVFSLIRNNKKKCKRYNIKSNYSNYAFYLSSCLDCLFGFGFGDDLCIKKVGNSTSCCNTICYDYRGEFLPLAEDDDNCFVVQRILVIEMN
ncbi:TLDc domain-containing protein [Entamoeba marina]